jgi:hypothetical protein
MFYPFLNRNSMFRFEQKNLNLTGVYGPSVVRHS